MNKALAVKFGPGLLETYLYVPRSRLQMAFYAWKTFKEAKPSRVGYRVRGNFESGKSEKGVSVP
jgi:hypothetical protein